MGQNRPLVSVLIPVYNVEDYLRECLDSLVSQTLESIEIVCVNDGATDSSSAILQEYAAKDDRIIIVNKKNGGLPSARNAGIEVARGEYIGFVDGDDSVEPNMFKKMYNAAIKNLSDMVVCGANCFPLEEEAPVWMKEALSPDSTVYTASTIQTFYRQKGATPFLWRTLVKRSLIETNGLRLDESIVLGEDLAFLYKLYSHAKRITFLSDKLYRYRWKRPNSIMEDLNYKDYTVRLFKHLKLIESMWQYSVASHAEEEKERIAFYEWAVGFIYWDAIKISLYKRIEVAIAFQKTLRSIGFFDCYDKYSERTKVFVRYFEGLTQQKATKPKLSIVIVFNGCKDYFAGFLDSIERQTCKDYEVIICTNGIGEEESRLIWERFFNNQKICIRVGEWMPLYRHYNETIATCNGEYILFANGFDIIKSDDWLERAITVLDENDSVTLVGQPIANCEGINDIRCCEDSHFRDFIYRLKFIRENRLGFEDYSFLTGSMFLTKYCLLGEKVYADQDVILHNEGLRRNTIYADEAKLLLRAMKEMLLIAHRDNLSSLGRRLTDMLNSENYIRLLTDSTYGFYIDKSSLSNPKEDFHREVLELLLECNGLSFLKKNEPSVLRTLTAFILKRHRFLENI